MKKVQNRTRSNQKSRRKPYREIGVFTKRGTLRVVELHPTKGFREQNGEGWRGAFNQAMADNKPIVLSRGKRTTTIKPMDVKVPTSMHRRTGG